MDGLVLLMTILFVGGFIWVLIATRKKPGRRYDKKPPVDASQDTWWWSP